MLRKGDGDPNRLQSYVEQVAAPKMMYMKYRDTRMEGMNLTLLF